MSRLRFRRSGPAVLAQQAGRVRVEATGVTRDGARPVAVVAHWSADSELSRSVRELLGQLRQRDYDLVVVSTSPVPAPLSGLDHDLDGVTVLRRPNLGYDFGSWATALHELPWIIEADDVLLLNDSLAGPFAPLDGLLGSFESTKADVWGMTDTTQFTHHLQSYALGFRRGALSETPLRRFWRDIRVERTKDDVIRRYEMGLSAMLRREAFVLEAAFPCRSVVEEGKNPTVIGWRNLLAAGFPFVKRELLRTPEVAPDGRHVPVVLQRMFGVTASDWI
jgi:lipopolysaccharide biosynthesis protein